MQLTAKLTQLLPLQTGTGENGEWKKQDIIIEKLKGNIQRKFAFLVDFICVNSLHNSIVTLFETKNNEYFRSL